MRYCTVLLHAVDRALFWICGLLVLAFAVLLVLQVVLRFAFGVPLFWLEEFCVFLLVGLTFLGAAMAWGRRAHVTVDMLPTMLPDSRRAILFVLVDVIVLFFALWAAKAGWEFAFFSMNKRALTMNMPVGYGYLAVPVAFAVVAVQSAIFLLLRLKGAAEPFATPQMEI